MVSIAIPLRLHDRAQLEELKDWSSTYGFSSDGGTPISLDIAYLLKGE